MITIAKEIEKEKILTFSDMYCGDSFIILEHGWSDVYLMCDNGTFVNISTGATYNVNSNNYKNLSVLKLDFTLVKK